MPFKRGAFEAGTSIKPVCHRYEYGLVSPQWNDMCQFALMIMMLSQIGFNTVNVYSMPIFIPNEYLYKTHADKAKDRAEIYAWAVRDAMSK